MNGLSGPSLIAAAIKIATEAHCATGKVRRDGSSEATAKLPYIVHPLRVMGYVAGCGGSYSAQAAAVLHDVIEDTAVTGDDWQIEIRELVLAVTHKPGQSKLDSIEQLVDGPPEAVLIKLADRYDNSTAETSGRDYFCRDDVLKSTVRLLAIARERVPGCTLIGELETLMTLYG